MSQIRLYLDEDILQRSLVKALRNANIDLMTTTEANNLSRSDEKQLIWSTQQKRAIYTFNVGDFCRLHQLYMNQEQKHTGIIIGKQTYSIGEQIKGFLNLIEQMTAEEIVNQLVFLSNYIK